MTTDSARSPAAEPASLRQRKKERTRRDLIAAALRLFERQGYDATTIDDIAAAADVSPRTYFRYFTSKEEVVFGEDVEPVLMNLVAARPADEPLLESVKQIAAAGIALQTEADREALLPRLRVIYRTPELHAHRMEVQLEMGRLSGAVLAERRGLPPDDLGARVAAAAALIAVEVAMERWTRGDGRDDLVELIDAALDALGAAFGGPPRSPDGQRTAADVP